MRRGRVIGKFIVNALSKPDLNVKNEPVPDERDPRWRVIQVAGYYVYFRFADPARDEGNYFRHVSQVVNDDYRSSKRSAQDRPQRTRRLADG